LQMGRPIFPIPIQPIWAEASIPTIARTLS
jgi:hypothetical protein